MFTELVVAFGAPVAGSMLIGEKEILSKRNLAIGLIAFAGLLIASQLAAPTTRLGVTRQIAYGRSNLVQVD